MKKRILIFSILICNNLLLVAQENKQNISLNLAYELFLNNIKNRDFEIAKTYVNNSDSIQFSDAGGNVLLTMEDYNNQLERFTKDTSWTNYKSEIISIKQYGDTGIIMEKAIISGINWEFKMLVTYVFHRIDDYWKMVADVCTKIEKN
jgi:hypothetical protein